MAIYSRTFNAIYQTLSKRLLSAASEPATIHACKKKVDKKQWAMNRIIELLLFDALELAHHYESAFDPRPGQKQLRERAIEQIGNLKSITPSYTGKDLAGQMWTQFNETVAKTIFSFDRTMFFEEEEWVNPEKPHPKMRYAQRAICQIKEGCLPKSEIPRVYAILKASYELCLHELEIVERYPLAKKRWTQLNHLLGEIHDAMRKLSDEEGNLVDFKSKTVKGIIDGVFEAYQHAADERTKVREPRFFVRYALLATMRDVIDHRTIKPLPNRPLTKILKRLKTSTTPLYTSALFMPLHHINLANHSDQRREIYEAYNKLVERSCRIPHPEDCATPIVRPDLMRAILFKYMVSPQTPS